MVGYQLALRTRFGILRQISVRAWEVKADGVRKTIQMMRLASHFDTSVSTKMSGELLLLIQLGKHMRERQPQLPMDTS
jgi:hypothetical protein